MIRIAFLLVLFLHSLSSAAEVSGDSPLRWAQGSIGWYYNAQNKPDWLEDAAALAFIQRAAAGWGACGLVHEFGHALGLGHSATPGDAMSVGARTRAEWVLPSANDLERCRERYPGR